MTKIGLGMLTLSGTNNSYTGLTTINAGVLQFSNTGALAGAGAASILINAGGRWPMRGPTPRSAAAGPRAGWAAARCPASAGAIALMGGTNNTDTLAISFSGYNSSVAGGPGGHDLSGTLTPGSNGYLLGGGGATLTVSSSLGDYNGGSTALTVTNSGTVVLAGTNSYTGGTTISNGSSLTFATPSAGPASGLIIINLRRRLRRQRRLHHRRRLALQRPDLHLFQRALALTANEGEALNLSTPVQQPLPGLDRQQYLQRHAHAGQQWFPVGRRRRNIDH